MAIILCISTLIILLMLGLGTFLGLSQIATLAVFPMLIMTTLSEKFVSTQSGKGFLAALLVLGETTAVALLCYFIVEWSYIQNTMLATPSSFSCSFSSTLCWAAGRVSACWNMSALKNSCGTPKNKFTIFSYVVFS